MFFLHDIYRTSICSPWTRRLKLFVGLMSFRLTADNLLGSLSVTLIDAAK